MKKFLATVLVASSIFAEAPRLTESQRAAHALNRLAFGARPGDIDRIVELGVDRWIAAQLRPERIPDTSVDARLKQFPTLALSEAQILEKFYEPIVDARRDKEKKDDSMRMLRREARQVMSDLTS
jgi:predicted aminopeptidase